MSLTRGSLLITENSELAFSFSPSSAVKKGGGSNKAVKSAWGSYLHTAETPVEVMAGIKIVTTDTRALYRTGIPGATVSVFQQWTKRCVAIEGGRTIGAENHVRLGG